MSVGGLLRGWRGGASAEPAPAPAEDDFTATDSTVDHKALLRSFEDSGDGWVWQSDTAGNFTYVSSAFERATGCDEGALVGSSAIDFFETDTASGASAGRSMRLIMPAHKAFHNRIVRIGEGERLTYWSVAGSPIFLGEDFAGYRGHGTDVTDEQKKSAQDNQFASFDSLTGLSNRARMEQKVDTTLAAFKAAKRSCALMMIDLDRFKQVNDMLGHAAGDELLIQVAERLGRVCDDKAEIARLGGDEFQIMIPDLDDRGQLGEIGQKIVAMLSQPFALTEGRTVIGASVGIAIAPYDGLDREELTHSADLALYAAKHGGRGLYRFYSADLKNSARDRRGIETDLERALTNGEFDLNFQPIATVKDNTVVAIEALLRWYSPERGSVPPDLFIPIAEDSNLMVQIGEWVLHEACREAVRWPSSLRLCVNVSCVQLMQEGFPATVTSALANAGLAPDRLELEVNEKVFLRDTQLIDEALAKLRGIGVRLALDDFGAGMSSLGYLKSAHFDTLKIDPEFLRDACTPGNRNGDLIRAIVALANALGMHSVAEAVEAGDELDLVRECGVTHVQGHIYAPPMDRDELRENVAGEKWAIAPDGPQHQASERRRVFRRINVIHEDHFYDVMLRDLSRTGAVVEGLADVPLDEKFVLDFGEGQLAVASVVHSEGDRQGLKFEILMVPDGMGGLCTRHRVSPYALAAAGMPLQMLPPGNYPLVGGEFGVQPTSMPKYAQLSDAAKAADERAG